MLPKNTGSLDCQNNRMFGPLLSLLVKKQINCIMCVVEG